MKLQMGLVLGGLALLASVSNAQTTTAVVAAPGTGTSTVVAPTSPAKKAWSVSLLEQLGQGLEKAKTTGGASSLTQLTLGYKLNDDWKMGLIGQATGAIAGEGETQNNELTYGDLGLSANTKAANFVAGGDPAAVSLRAYLPTSASAYKNKKQVGLRADYSITTPSIGKWNGESYFSARYNLFQEQTDNGIVIVQPAARYSFNDKVSAYGSLGYVISIEDNNGLKRTSETAGPEVGMDMSVLSNFDMTVAVSQSVEINKPAAKQEKYSLFDTDSTEYTLIGVVRF